MRMKGLTLETIPPIHIPFRFFNTAPWMGVLAALVLLLAAATGILAAALLLAADFAWLGFTLASATVLYRNTAVRIAQAL